MNTIQTAQTLKARSICDSEHFFTLTVLERKGQFATVRFQGKDRRTKVRTDYSGEYLRPDNYSMAPIFRA